MEDRIIKNLERFDEEPKDIMEIYELLVKIFKKWIDMNEEDIKFLSLWVIGCVFHHKFEAYPYLYFNAMRGSGKSRMLKLLAYILGGTHTVNMTEAVLFRENNPLMIDEAENLRGKEKANLRELLNVAYKKGGVVKRARKDIKTEGYVIDSFLVYRPVAIANITGMDDVLESRCISRKLEKSFNKEITRRVELFSKEKDILLVKNYFQKVMNVDTSDTPLTIINAYEGVVNRLNNNVVGGSSGSSVNSVIIDRIMEKVEKGNLMGRDMELWLPIFVIASIISERLLNEMIILAEADAEEKKESDMLENRDIGLVSFLLWFIKEKEEKDFFSVSEIVKEYLLLEVGDKEWFTSDWVGRALRRNVLVIEKRRGKRGREVRLNFSKIKEKAGKFGVDEKKIEEKAKEIDVDSSKLDQFFNASDSTEH